MKKLLLLMFVLPLFTTAQDLPVIYTYLSEGAKYIDRDIWLKGEINNYTNSFFDDNDEDICPDCFEHLKNDGTLSEEMYFQCLKECQYGDSWVFGITPDVVSSELDPQGKNTYTRFNVGDRDPRTAWVEGKNDYGVGEYIEMRDIHTDAIKTMIILNGYQKSIKSWKDNSRIKTLKVYANGEATAYIHLEDRMGKQIIDFRYLLPEDFHTYDDEKVTIRLEITDVYKGERWKDVAISDIMIFWCYGC